MSSIVVLFALTLLATGCWYTHHWSGTHEHERNQWNNQLHTLQTARITLAAGDYATPALSAAIPADCIPPALLDSLIRRGSPLDGVLAAAEDTLRTKLHAHSHQRSVLAGVRATALIMEALPGVGILVGYLLGAHPLHFLTHGWGSLALLTGVALQTTGLWWIHHMVGHLPPPNNDAALKLPLLAALLRAGMHVDDACAHLSPIPTCCETLLRLSSRQGAPIAAQLDALARDQQAQALAHCEEATEEMSVLLARPLGLCFLPAFMLLGVVPTVLELGGSYMQHFT